MRIGPVAGELISSILYPPVMTFKYDEELPILMLLLVLYAVVVFVVAVVFMSLSGALTTALTTLTYGLCTVVQILNPLLPVSLVSGNPVSAKRLAAQGVPPPPPHTPPHSPFAVGDLQ